MTLGLQLMQKQIRERCSLMKIQTANKSKENKRWDQFLLREVPNSVKIFKNKDCGRSVAYQRICKMIRFLEVVKNNGNLTIYILSEPTIPLERVLTLNTQQDDFLLYRENEEELRQAFKELLMDKIEQAELEEKTKIEALEQLQREEEAKRAASEKFRYEAEERSKFSPERMTKADEQIEQEMLQRAKAANERPVGMTTEEWEWYKKTGRTFSKRKNGSTQPQPVSTYQTTKTKVEKEQWAKFMEKLLSHPIRGDHFIDGHASHWRKFILKWIKEHQHYVNLSLNEKAIK
jgi:hypothetical protein